jgi:hypothetical protein
MDLQEDWVDRQVAGVGKVMRNFLLEAGLKD